MRSEHVGVGSLARTCFDGQQVPRGQSHGKFNMYAWWCSRLAKPDTLVSPEPLPERQPAQIGDIMSQVMQLSNHMLVNRLVFSRRTPMPMGRSSNAPQHVCGASKHSCHAEVSLNLLRAQKPSCCVAIRACEHLWLSQLLPVYYDRRHILRRAPKLSHALSPLSVMACR